VTVVHATVGLWRALLDRTVVDGTVVVRDGGFTEIPAGTLTAVATWSPEVRELAARLGQ
jgi:peptidyl-tRNA hydrolase